MAAGKEVLRFAKEHLKRRESFAVETTLSGKNYLRMMRYAREIDQGFEVVLIYIGTASVEINLARIAKRVRAGGHDVPEMDVRRRLSITPRRLRFLALGGNGDLRHAPLLSIHANGAQDFLFGNLS
jgi:predicted ABC-type ATPase